MDEVTTNGSGLRRVGLNEGLQHMAGAAVALAALAQRFEGAAGAWMLVLGALTWGLAYVALRLARQRWWFGGWDALSFGFVWSYAIVLALTIQLAVSHWV